MPCVLMDVRVPVWVTSYVAGPHIWAVSLYLMAEQSGHRYEDEFHPSGDFLAAIFDK